MLLGVQLDDQVLLDGQIDVLRGGILSPVPLRAHSVLPSHLGNRTGGVLTGQALELDGGAAESSTSITSPAFTR